MIDLFGVKQTDEDIFDDYDDDEEVEEEKWERLKITSFAKEETIIYLCHSSKT